MSKPILCIGSYAKTPYHIEKIGRNVYCIEELCYCIVKNAFLLDEESFTRDLFDWIERTPLRIVNRALDKTGLAALEILLATDYLFEGTFDWNDGGKISFLLMAGAIAVGFVYHFVIEKFRIVWRRLVRPRVSEEAP